MKENKQIDRREFFRVCSRGVIAGGMAALAAVMWKRNQSSLSEQKCFNRGICGPCRAFEKCQLPQALSAKQVMEKS